MTNYDTSKAALGFFELLAWIVTIGGVILALYSYSNASSGFGSSSATKMLAATPGIMIAFLGIVSIVMIHVARATIDTAELSRQLVNQSSEMLAIARKQAVQSGPASKVVGKNAPSPATQKYQMPAPNPQPKPEMVQPPSNATRSVPYNGRELLVKPSGVFIGGMRFDSIDRAKAHIDGQTLRATRET